MRPSSVSLYDLQHWAKRAGFELAEDTLRPLAGYLDLLTQWNRVMNLVGTRTAEETFDTLVVDSLHLGGFLREKAGLPDAPSCWDLGSGAGLPGVPLRMVWQAGDYWMVEAREKRALFLSTVLAKYPLPGTHVFRGRAEAFMAGPPARTADLVVSRAFMPWPKVLELVQDQLTPEGVVVLLLRERLQDSPDWEQAVRHWRLFAASDYPVARTKRFLFALSRHNAPSCPS
uniref:16S rRNA (guanine(527)-N(7))-methyltransferase RsmG n=1 Tax=uncultured Bilophila sp. TaxID=529385 RepID=UPI0025DDDCA5|nr:16S rRNA (guanine(527)-N(7))-methyltransferase RsmG [uncultured Bilophila sp.]